MTLADERLRQPDSPLLAEGEGALLRCRAAAGFINKGQYEAAREALGGLWAGVGQRPEVGNLPPAVAAEVLLQCGSLAGWLGSGGNVPGAQERAKDLLSEALRRFMSLGQHAKVSEAQYELGYCYWRLGAYDEARVVLEEALRHLTDADVELKAKILIRRSIVEQCENQFHEALRILKEAEPVFASADDALKGKWHGEKGLILARLADKEGSAAYAAYTDRAIIEFTAAIHHFEQARHERYRAAYLNNLAMLLYRVGRNRDAHENLDRAGAVLRTLNDAGLLAQVDETRARVFLAEEKYEEADRVITRAVRALEQGGESALFADALVVQGVARARLGDGEGSIGVLRRAAEVAEGAGALTNAGLALLALIEEHGSGRLLTQGEIYKAYRRADRLLKDTQDAEDYARLRACARVVMRRLAGVHTYDKTYSFFSAVHEFEAKIIEQALGEAGGSVTRAAKLLGLTHQTLGTMLSQRHKQLADKRKPRRRRLRSIIKGPKG
jgi:tetratricopeptide (TPR) repeat protein